MSVWVGAVMRGMVCAPKDQIDRWSKLCEDRDRTCQWIKIINRVMPEKKSFFEGEMPGVRDPALFTSDTGTLLACYGHSEGIQTARCPASNRAVENGQVAAAQVPRSTVDSG